MGALFALAWRFVLLWTLLTFILPPVLSLLVSIIVIVLWAGNANKNERT